MFSDLMQWLHDENNRAIVMMGGAGLAFLWTAGFAVYTRIQDQRARAEEQAKKIPARERAQNQRRGPVRAQGRIFGAIGLWVVGIVVLAYGGFELFGKKTITTEYTVCTGEYEASCQPHQAYLYCYVDPATAAAKACKRYRIKDSHSYGGNKCGYGMYTYLCTNEAP